MFAWVLILCPLWGQNAPACCTPSPQKVKRQEIKQNLTSTKHGQYYRYSVKGMETRGRFQRCYTRKTFKYLIKYTYSFLSVPFPWPAIYSKPLLYFFPSSHSFRMPFTAQKFLRKQFHGFAIMIPGILCSWRLASKLNYWITEEIYWGMQSHGGGGSGGMGFLRNRIRFHILTLPSRARLTALSDFMPAFDNIWATFWIF